MSTVINSKMVAANVRAWRNFLGIKQQVVADELEIRREWYVKLENGLANLRVEQLLTIARLFDVEPEEFFKTKVDFERQKSIHFVSTSTELEHLVEQKIVEIMSQFFQTRKM